MALEMDRNCAHSKNSTKCNEISFDPNSFSEQLKGLLENSI